MVMHHAIYRLNVHGFIKIKNKKQEKKRACTNSEILALECITMFNMSALHK